MPQGTRNYQKLFRFSVASRYENNRSKTKLTNILFSNKTRSKKIIIFIKIR